MFFFILASKVCTFNTLAHRIKPGERQICQKVLNKFKFVQNLEGPGERFRDPNPDRTPQF